MCCFRFLAWKLFDLIDAGLICSFASFWISIAGLVSLLIYCVAFVELRLTCRQSNDTGHLSMSGLGNNNPQCQTIDEAPKSNLTLSLTFSSENFETQVAIDGSQ